MCVCVCVCVSLLTNCCLKTGVVLEECRPIIIGNLEARISMTDKTIQIVNALIGIIPAVEMIFALIKCGGLLEGARSIIGAFV